METQNPQTADLAQLALIQKKISLDNRIRAGVNWFFWIAGLSLLNTVIYMTGSTLTFVVGLGATQFVDGFMGALAKSLSQGGIIVSIVGLAMDVCIAGAFVVVGVLGRKRLSWAIILGMVVYTLDGILMLVFKDYLGTLFHAVALFSIWTGFKATRELKVLEAAGPSESIESIRQRMPALGQPAATPKQVRTRLILVGLIVLAVIAFFVIFALSQGQP